jgi:hypothetical protein
MDYDTQQRRIDTGGSDSCPHDMFFQPAGVYDTIGGRLTRGHPGSGFSMLSVCSAMTRLHIAAIGSARMLGFRTENSDKPYHGSRFGEDDITRL